MQKEYSQWFDSLLIALPDLDVTWKNKEYSGRMKKLDIF